MSDDVFLNIVETMDEYQVKYGGTHEELVKMMVEIAGHDEDLKIIFHAAGAAIEYLDGMNDVQEQINNL